MARTITTGRGGSPALALSASMLCASLVGPIPCRAAEEPLWEVGAGVGVLGYDDYRGANTSHVYPVPVPYVLYNGPVLVTDRDGAHARLFDQKWVEIRFSFSATTPVSNDRTRSGMPRLRPTLDAGASLDLHLWESEDARAKFDVRLPVRSAIAVESPPQAVGWTFSPSLALDLTQHPGDGAWKLGLLAGPLFANRRYNSYFYSVQAQFATLSRPEYQASGGYAGTQFISALSKRFPRYWVGAFLRYDTLSGAVFADSPLVRSDRYWTGGVGIAWPIRTSTRRVEVPD